MNHAKNTITHMIVHTEQIMIHRIICARIQFDKYYCLTYLQLSVCEIGMTT